MSSFLFWYIRSTSPQYYLCKTSKKSKNEVSKCLKSTKQQIVSTEVYSSLFLHNSSFSLQEPLIYKHWVNHSVIVVFRIEEHLLTASVEIELSINVASGLFIYFSQQILMVLFEFFFFQKAHKN